MKHNKTLSAIGLLIIVGAGWLLLLPRHPVKEDVSSVQKKPAPEASPTYITTTAARQSPGGPYAPADPRWPERTRSAGAARTSRGHDADPRDLPV